MATIEQALNQGWRLHQAGQIDHALNVYRQVLAQAPSSAEAMVYLGIALFDKRQFAESAEYYRQALKIRDRFPIAWNNLGNSLRMQGLVEEAEKCFEKSIRQDPTYLSAYKNRGTLWIWNGDIERGMQWYQAGLEAHPGDPEMHRNIGVIELLRGNYNVGWPEYRWRWQMPGMVRPRCAAPVWRGEPLHGRAILLYPEQGRGDSIQFIRMAKVLSDSGARVVFQCPREMIPLFVSAQGIEKIIPLDVASPKVHFQASLVETVDAWYSVHNEMPYATEYAQDGYLTVSTGLIDYWATWLNDNHPVESNVKRIGINWQGNREHHADLYRSIPLSALQPLTEMRNTQLINLQFGDGIEQLDQVDFADSIIRLPNDIDTTGGAFTDTAAILKNLDAVVTSDTAIAHLAGAVGTKTWLMLGRIPDWRWLTTGRSTQWYPSMHLLRQREIGSWDDVVENVVSEIPRFS